MDSITIIGNALLQGQCTMCISRLDQFWLIIQSNCHSSLQTSKVICWESFFFLNFFLKQKYNVFTFDSTCICRIFQKSYSPNWYRYHFNVNQRNVLSCREPWIHQMYVYWKERLFKCLIIVQHKPLNFCSSVV